MQKVELDLCDLRIVAEHAGRMCRSAIEEERPHTAQREAKHAAHFARLYRKEHDELDRLSLGF